MKKVVILMLVLISSLFLYASFVSGGACDSPEVCGDTDGDGIVTILDAYRAALSSAGVPVQGVAFNYDCANVDGRGGVTVIDAQMIATKTSGVAVTFNCPTTSTPSPTPTLTPTPTLSTSGASTTYCGDRIVQDTPIPGRTATEECDPNGRFSPAGYAQCTRTVPGPRGLLRYDTDCCSPYQGLNCAKSPSTAGQRSPDTACQCVFSGTSNDGSASTSATAPVAAPAVITPVATGASSPIVSTASPTISRRITPIAKASDVMNPPSFLPSGVSSIATMLVLFGLLVSLIFLFKRD